MRGNVRLAQVPCCTDEADMIWEGFGFFFFPSMLLRHSAVHMPTSCSRGGCEVMSRMAPDCLFLEP